MIEKKFAFAWDWGKAEIGNAGSMDVSDTLEEAKDAAICSYEENMELVEEWKTEDAASWNLMIDEYRAWVEELVDGEYVKVWEASVEELEAIGWKKV